MSHFYGTIQGNRGEATRCGSKDSGFSAVAASWDGSVSVRLFNQDGEDFATVSLEPWHGAGTSKLLYSGPVSGPTES